jgi:hypothetical protein
MVDGADLCCPPTWRFAVRQRGIPCPPTGSMTCPVSARPRPNRPHSETGPNYPCRLTFSGLHVEEPRKGCVQRALTDAYSDTTDAVWRPSRKSQEAA